MPLFRHGAEPDGADAPGKTVYLYPDIFGPADTGAFSIIQQSLSRLSGWRHVHQQTFQLPFQPPTFPPLLPRRQNHPAIEQKNPTHHDGGKHEPGKYPDQRGEIKLPKLLKKPLLRVAADLED